MLNLNDLYLFAQVVECRGFASASRHTGIPKATLSKRIAALEQQLDVRLIQRTSRSFLVTEIGLEFYRHAAAMLLEAAAAENVVRGRLSEPSGTVRISASVPTAQLLLTPLLPGFALKYPQVLINLEATDRFVDIVQEGFDLILRDHFAKLPDSGLVQRHVGVDPVCVVASPDYLREFGVPGSPEELSQHRGLLTGGSATTWTLRHKDKQQVSVTPIPRFIANDTTALLSALDLGLGVCCLPLSLCRTQLAAGRLMHLLPDWTAGSVTTTLLMPHRRGLLPAVRLAADFLIENLRNKF